ncbi:MAG: condensation domain-containing protein, partial [Caulobacteraceae bacterium]
MLDGMMSGESIALRPDEAVRARPPGLTAPLSPEQSQVWLHASLAAPHPLYNEAITIRRSGTFSLDALEDAFNEILRRHEIWRTSIEVAEG